MPGSAGDYETTEWPEYDKRISTRFENSMRCWARQQQCDKTCVFLFKGCLGQTGDGHFSPIAAYHAESDSVLVMDVARFKYPPYWASVEDLYQAMQPIDEATQKSRGWFLLTDPPRHGVATSNGNDVHDIHKLERRRPAKLVPLVGQPDICPIGKIKVQFCKVAPKAGSGGATRTES
ncbi:Phytochelatin synthase [Fragilaria crotonensis]|nr:Phytochelatin synthase [Fragilaria crotonensis]